MPFYHFKLVDTRIVGDHGTHDLVDETTALRSDQARTIVARGAAGISRHELRGFGHG
jgi:hypothetical protein